jgi:hypothetical protein
VLDALRRMLALALLALLILAVSYFDQPGGPM